MQKSINRALRVSFTRPCIIRGPGETKTRCRFKNISLSGAALLTNQLWEPGTELSLEWDYRGAQFKVRGEFVRDRNELVGIRFTDLDEDTANHVRTLLGSHGRLSGRTNARIAFLSASVAKPSAHLTSDVSIGGCCLHLEEEPEDNDEVDLVLPGTELLPVRARVVWHSGLTAGVQFLSPSPEFFETWSRLVDYHQKKTTREKSTRRTLNNAFLGLIDIGLSPAAILIGLCYLLLLPFSPMGNVLAETRWVAYIVGGIQVVALSMVVNGLPFLKGKRLAIANWLLLVAFGVFAGWELNTTGKATIGLMTDNLDEFLTWSSLTMILSEISTTQWCVLLAGTGALVWAEHRFHLLSSASIALSRPRVMAMGAVAWIGLAVLNPPTADPLSYFAASARDQAERVGATLQELLPNEDYPLSRTTESSGESVPKERWPNIFLVMVESFSYDFVTGETPEGRAIAPFFGSLIDKGISVERYYGNSVQTIRGHTTALCSLIPTTKQKILHFYNPDLFCLPALLRESGYRTVFIQGQETLSFDGTDMYQYKFGFDEVLGSGDLDLHPEDREKIWGWGLQDDVLYEKTFEFLSEERSTTEKPFFVVLAPVSNHRDFDAMPHELKFIYPEPDSTQERFTNSIHLADRHLKRFFEVLREQEFAENTVVIITGDHAMPIARSPGQEIGSFEENFRLPFVLIYDGYITPRRIAERPHSHLDIAPTIVDLLGIQREVSFAGKSIFLDNLSASRPILMAQPYDGRHAVAIRYPYKYVQRERPPGERLFNLDSDPNEQRDLIRFYRSSPILARLRKDALQIQLNQLLIEQNRISPYATERSKRLEKTRDDESAADRAATEDSIFQ